MRRTALAALLAQAALTAPAAMAEDQVVCTVSGCVTILLEVSPFAGADNFSVDQVWTVVNDILSVSGLAPNFLVVTTDKVDNAAAVNIKGERYLAFNPDWMNQYKQSPSAKWQLYGVMAHEVGHHLQGHTITGTGSRPPTELEADEYAGFTLAALGASLQEAQSLFMTLPEQGSATHPPRHQRLQAVQRGWERQTGRRAPAAPAPVAQQPAPAAPSAHNAAAGEICVNVTYDTVPTRACVSSALAPQGNNRYDMANAFDNDPSTAWVEGRSGQGIGDYMALDFAQGVDFSEFGFRNGYTKSASTFERNSRIKTLRIEGSNGVSLRVNMRDTPESQYVDVTNLRGVSWITLTIEAVYPGSRYEDTALSELSLR